MLINDYITAKFSVEVEIDITEIYEDFCEFLEIYQEYNVICSDYDLNQAFQEFVYEDEEDDYQVLSRLKELIDEKLEKESRNLTASLEDKNYEEFFTSYKSSYGKGLKAYCKYGYRIEELTDIINQLETIVIGLYKKMKGK